MKNQSFTKMNAIEKKSKLLKIMIQKTRGIYSIEELKQIINNINIDCQFKITTIINPKELASRATLVKNEDVHSWAGESSTIQDGMALLGNIEFGESLSYQYSENGNITRDENEHIDPKFNCDEKIAFLLVTNTHDSYNNKSINDTELEIIIYLPSNFEYDKEVMELVKYFDCEVV